MAGRSAKMNSFCLESPRPFKAYLVERAARELLAEAMGPAAEGPQVGAALALHLATELREKVVELDFLRYKFMVVVQVTDKGSQGLHVCSRFLWDSERDTYATCRHETETTIVLITVFAVYYD